MKAAFCPDQPDRFTDHCFGPGTCLPPAFRVVLGRPGRENSYFYGRPEGHAIDQARAPGMGSARKNIQGHDAPSLPACPVTQRNRALEAPVLCRRRCLDGDDFDTRKSVAFQIAGGEIRIVRCSQQLGESIDGSACSDDTVVAPLAIRRHCLIELAGCQPTFDDEQPGSGYRVIRRQERVGTQAGQS